MNLAFRLFGPHYDGRCRDPHHVVLRKLGDEMNRYKAQGTARTMKIAVLDLVQAAMRLYPKSEFSAMHHGPMN